MSISGLLGRFLVVYPVAAISLAAALTYIDPASDARMDLPALLGTCAWLFMEFGKKNGRYFTAEESAQVLVGLVAIDMIVQLAGLMAVAPTGAVATGGAAVVLILGVTGLLHGVVIYIFLRLARRWLIKQGMISQDT